MTKRSDKEKNSEIEMQETRFPESSGRKNIEATMLEIEKKYKTLYESIDEGFCIIEVFFDDDENPVDYRFLLTNPAFERQTGLKDSEGKNIHELFPEQEQQWTEILGKVALTGEPIHFENTSDTITSWQRVHAFRFGEPEERKVALLFKDSSEHFNALLKAIIEGSDDAIISKNLNGVITSWNPGAEKLFGYRAPDIIGKSVTILIPDDRIDEETEILSRLREGERVDHFETIRICKDGEQLHVSLTISPILNSAGEIVGASKIARDITTQKEAEEKLQTINETLEERVEKRTTALLSYQKQLRSLVSKLSKAEEYERQRLATELHDNLGQTLTIGKMKLDQLKKRSAAITSETDMEELERLLSEAIRYTRELMLDLKPPPTLNKRNLKETVEWVANKMQKYELDVTLEDDGLPKPLSEDILTTLRQCVRELLFNVVKHADTNKAYITMSRVDNQVQIIVEDTGTGFKPGKKKLIPDNENGFGLFNIIERMNLLNGSFEIKSSPQSGTKAILRAPLKGVDTATDITQLPDLPLKPDVEKGKPAAELPVDDVQFEKIKVLLADDHRMMREGLRKIIEEEEDIIIVAEAADGKEAVEMARQTSPHVIVMDVNMPGMNGIQATRNIISAIPNVHIIGLSLHDSDNVAISMKKAGASAYLTKTEAFEALVKTIRREASQKK